MIQMLQVLRMYDLGGELLNVIRNMFVNSLVCVGINGPWHLNMYVDILMKEVKIRIGRIRVMFLGKEKEWRLSDLLYADDLVL